MEQQYRRILNKLIGIEAIDIQIAICVKLTGVSDKSYEIMCKYVRSVWNDCYIGYTQLIADVVYELYSSHKITKDDMIHYKNKDQVLVKIHDRYYS